MAAQNWQPWAAKRFRERLQEQGDDWVIPLFCRFVYAHDRETVESLWTNTILLRSIQDSAMDGSHPSHYGKVQQWINEALYDIRRQKTHRESTHTNEHSSGGSKTRSRSPAFYQEQRKASGLFDTEDEPPETCSLKESKPSASSDPPVRQKGDGQSEDETTDATVVDLEAWKRRMTEKLSEFDKGTRNDERS